MKKNNIEKVTGEYDAMVVAKNGTYILKITGGWSNIVCFIIEIFGLKMENINQIRNFG